MGYEIVPYAPRFEAAVAELQRGLWTPDARVNAAYLRWKFLENPCGTEPLIYLALADGEVVAMRGFFGSRWEAGGAAAPEPMPHADDLIVVPAHQSRGVVKVLMAYAFDDLARRGYRRVINLGARPVTMLSSLADGWRRVGGVAAAGFDREPSALREIRGRMKRAPGLWRVEQALRRVRMAHPFRRLDRTARTNRSGPVTLCAAPRPDAMAALVGSRPWDGRIRHVRDSAYFGWRFRHPFHDYRFLFWGDGELRGYLVLGRSVSQLDDTMRVRLVDWCAPDPGMLQTLLTTALEWGRFSRFETWTAGLDDSTRTLLEAGGCVPLAQAGLRSQGKGLLLRTLDGTWAAVGRQDPLRLDSWQLSLLDAMEG